MKFIKRIQLVNQAVQEQLEKGQAKYKFSLSKHQNLFVAFLPIGKSISHLSKHVKEMQLIALSLEPQVPA